MSVDTNPGGSPRESTIFQIQSTVNLFAVLLCIILTFGGVKLTQFLPEKLYFSFSKVVDANNSPFLISPPAHLTEEEVCEILKRKGDLKKLCESPPDGEAEPPTETSDRDLKAADAEIRSAAGNRFASNLAGYGLRLLVPLLAGLITGRIFGLAGVLPSAVGAAAAALLISWPVIVLWDRVVSPSFYEMYPQFVTLYALNMVGFFFVAKIGALLGAYLRDRGAILSLNFSRIVEAVIVASASGVAKTILDGYILKS